MELPGKSAGFFSSLPKGYRALFALYALAIALVYFLLQNNYRPHDVDDAWSLSFLYNYVNHGATTDLAFGDPLNGVAFFGKIHALLIGHLLNILGWTRTGAHLLSILFVLAALLLWVYLLQKLAYRLELALSFGLTALLADAFFTPATSTRLDAYVFLWVSLALALFVAHRYGLSMVAAWLALESHPIGAIAFFYTAAVVAASPSHRKRLLEKPGPGWPWAAGGFLAGALLFYGLHADALSQLPALLAEKNVPTGVSAYGSLYDYFFKTRYGRHIPELLLFLFALGLYLGKRFYKSENFTWAFLAVTTLAAVLIRRPNFHYAVFFYPALLLLSLRAFEAWGRLRFLLILWLCLLLPQYAFVFAQNRHFDFREEIRSVKAAVPDDGLPVVANANEWFAFNGRPFYYFNYMGDYQKLGLGRFYLVEDDDYRALDGGMKKWLEGGFKKNPVGTVTVGGRLFNVEKLNPRP